MPNPTPTDAVVRLAVRSDRLYSRKKSELMSTQHSTELVDSFEQFFKQYHDQRDAEDGNTDILDLAQRYPNEQKSLEVDWSDLFRFDPGSSGRRSCRAGATTTLCRRGATSL